MSYLTVMILPQQRTLNKSAVDSNKLITLTLWLKVQLLFQQTQLLFLPTEGISRILSIYWPNSHQGWNWSRTRWWRRGCQCCCCTQSPWCCSLAQHQWWSDCRWYRYLDPATLPFQKLKKYIYDNKAAYNIHWNRTRDFGSRTVHVYSVCPCSIWLWHDIIIFRSWQTETISDPSIFTIMAIWCTRIWRYKSCNRWNMCRRNEICCIFL